MSIPYLPGWWDMLNQNGAVTNVVKGIDKRMRPDAYANQNLQQAIQQNPMLLDQISNMDPTQRQMLASGFGFRNANPFGGIAEGEQLTERKMKQDAIKSLTPEQMTQKKAKLAGVDTQESIDRTKVLQGREDTLFAQGQKEAGQRNTLNDLNIQILNGKVKDIKTVDAQIEAAKAAYPTLKSVNMRALARSIVRGPGTPVDNQLVTAIQSDPGAKEIFDLAKSAELDAYRNELSLRLAKAKDPNTGMLYLRTLTEIGNQYNDQEARIMQQYAITKKELENLPAYVLGKLPNANKINKAAADSIEAQQLGPLTKQLDEIRRAASENRMRLEDMTTQMHSATTGVKVDLAKETKDAQDAIAKHPELTATIRMKYKQRTGKDLP